MDDSFVLIFIILYFFFFAFIFVLKLKATVATQFSTCVSYTSDFQKHGKSVSHLRYMEWEAREKMNLSKR